MCVLTYAYLLQLIAGKGAKGAMATQCEAMESDSKLVDSNAESGKKRELPDDVLESLSSSSSAPRRRQSRGRSQRGDQVAPVTTSLR